jgi:peptidyl-prolyl cis-trans isomerase A (cyclophilin A)
VDSIANTQTNPRNDRPVNDVVIETIVITGDAAAQG